MNWNAFVDWISSEHFSFWGLNVLLQSTFVCAVALLLAVGLRRNSALRYGVLCSGLMLLLATPIVAGLMQWSGYGMFAISITEVPVTQVIDTDRPLPTQASQTSVPPSAGNSEPAGAAADVATRTSPASPSATPADAVAVTDVSSRSRELIERILSAAPWLLGLYRWGIPLLLIVWLAGATLLLVRLIRGWRRLAAILRAARPNTDPNLTTAFVASQTDALGRAIRNRLRRAELVISDHVTGPVAAGLWRPRVVLPASLVGRLTDDEARQILLHEMAHIVRRDQIIVLLQNVAAAVFWLHPLARLLNQQLARAREEVCDNHVLAMTAASAYSRTLLALAGSLQLARPLPGTVGLFTSQWSLERRVAGLLDGRRNRTIRMTRTGQCLIVALSICNLSLVSLGTISSADDFTTDDAVAFIDTPPLQQHTVSGIVTTSNGDPVPGATMTVLSRRITNFDSHGMVLAKGTTDATGHFQLTLDGVSVTTHSPPTVIAYSAGRALAWKRIDLDAAATQVDLQLQPQQLIPVRLVDDQGQPAANLNVELTSVTLTNGKGWSEQALSLHETPSTPDIGLPRLTTDAEGRIDFPSIPANYGVYFRVVGSDRFATQHVVLNTGMREERPPNDGTYRYLVKNFPPGKLATIPLEPSRIFEGTILLGQTGQPAPNARIMIWSSQQALSGSMIGLEGQADAQGHFKINPYPGVRFGISAFPPPGEPYLARRMDDLTWNPGDRVRTLAIQLPAGFLAQGTVVDARTGQPLVGVSVEYHPMKVNRQLTDAIVNGWQNTQQTNARGQFKLAVPQGSGTLVVRAPRGSNYVLQEMGSRELGGGLPGGTRNYAHAFHKFIAPDTKQGSPQVDSLAPITIKLRPGATVAARLVDPSGAPIDDAIFTSRLSTYYTQWRAEPEKTHGGIAKLRGVQKGKRYPVSFLDPVKRLGATAVISTADLHPTIKLQPCASARVRFVNQTGKPVKAGQLLLIQMVITPGKSEYNSNLLEYFTLAADEDFATNFDRVTYAKSPVTDANGEVFYPVLVPGTTYRFVNHNSGAAVQKEFVAQPGKLHDMGQIVVDVD